LPEDISPLDEPNPQFCPLPDAIVVYGLYYKRYLINKGHYPPQKIYPFGFQKADILLQSKKMFDKNKICSEFRLNPNKKRITLVTLHLLGDAIRKKIFELTVAAVKQFDNAEFIVKMHPFETDKKTYENIVSEQKLKDWIILKKEDMQKILFISDIVITTVSTAGIEAIILNKPLVIVDISEKPPLIDYVGYGAAIRVTNAKELVKAIEDILTNPKVRKALEIGRKKFINDYNYKNDGKASYRIAKLIENMLQ
jgi:UDP-N-acetylglucosamine 2-epimerase